MFLTRVLLLVEVEVWHEQTSAAATVVYSVSGTVARASPADASTFDEKLSRVAWLRAGKPAPVLFDKVQTHPPTAGGAPPGGVPAGGVNVKLQLLGKPNSAAVYWGTVWSLSVSAKRVLRDLAWEVARSTASVAKVAFIVFNYLVFGN